MLTRRAKERISLDLSISVAQFLSDYDSSSAKTKSNYADNLASFVTFAESRDVTMVGSVSAQLIRDYLGWLKDYRYKRPRSTVEKALSTATIQHRQGVVRTYLRWAVLQKQISESPMERVRPVKGEVRARHAFSRDEAKRLVVESEKGAGWIGYRDQALVLVMLGTGCRANELLSITPGHFGWKSKEGTAGGHRSEMNRVLLNGKGAIDRRASLGDRAAAAVRAYIRHRPKWIPEGADQPFWWTIRKEPMEYSALVSMTKYLGRYADVQDCTPHRFRHTFASEFYRTNKDIMALKNRLGHAKIETTMTYLRALGIDYGYGDDYKSPDDLF